MTYEHNNEIKTLIEAQGEAINEFVSKERRRIDDLEKSIGLMAIGVGGFGGGDDRESKAELAGFMRAERKAMSVGSDPAGGYTVQATLSESFTATIRESSPVRQSGARVVQIGSDAFEEPIDRDEAGVNWVDEATTRAATSTPNLGLMRIPVHEMSAEPRATQKLLDDSNIDIAAWLIARVGEKMGRSESAAFVAGSGIGQPRGFVTYPTAATSDDTRAWGVVEHVATGVSAGFPASNPADVLFDLVDRMKPAYLAGACWFMPRAVATAVRKWKENTTNAYIWQPGLQKAEPPTLLGYPVYLSPDMPAVGAGSLSVAFLNPARAYTIVDRLGVAVLRDPFSARPNVVFATRRRVGGDVSNFEAVKLLKFA